MKSMNRRNLTYRIALSVLVGIVEFHCLAAEESPLVTAPPNSFFELLRERDRDVARQFYRKHINVQGMPVAAAAEVSDLALQRTYSIVTHFAAA